MNKEEIITALRELHIWKFCTKEEREEVRQCPDDYALLSRLSRKLREKYWDQVMTEEENREQVDKMADDMPISRSGISKRIKFALYRNNITSTDELLNFLKHKKKIRGIGPKGNKEIQKYVQKLKGKAV